MMSDTKEAATPSYGNDIYPEYPAANPAIAQPQYLTQHKHGFYIPTYPKVRVPTYPMHAGVVPIPMQPEWMKNPPQVGIGRSFAILPLPPHNCNFNVLINTGFTIYNITEEGLPKLLLLRRPTYRGYCYINSQYYWRITD